MTTIYWGYDSAAASNAFVPGTTTLVDDYVRGNFAAPAFIARYTEAIAGLSDGLTPGEVAFDHQRGAADIPIYNRTSAANVAGSFQDGWDHAQVFIDSLVALGVPKGVCGFIDFETNMDPTADEIRGFAANMHRAQYNAGLYLNSEKQEHIDAYIAAALATAFPIYIWSSESEPNALFGKVIDTFTPDVSLLGAWAKFVVAWQYCENVGNIVDFNTGTQQLMDMAYGTTPPVVVPKIYRMVTPAMLKAVPAHTSDAAIDPHHNKVYLELGAQVVPTGRIKKTDDRWGEVHLLQGESVVHGWLPIATYAQSDA